MEAPSVYGTIAADHLRAPRNLGKLNEADGVGTVEDEASQTMLTMYVKLGAHPDDQPVIVEARFRAFGCGGCIVTGSVATELVKGHPLAYGETLDGAAIELALDHGLPANQRYCAELAARALRIACQTASIRASQPS